MISNIIRSIVKYLMRKIIKYISIIGIACLVLLFFISNVETRVKTQEEQLFLAVEDGNAQEV
ncbi:hypothetical protein E0495_03525 [Wolbachia pipientis]|uniref:Uncharacterized protein n=3 Tax=Wolbachieae TaxID=952 RepID=A0A6I6CF75_WOLPI|nr:hypothetical protein [Wolbachia endosymbiont of Ceratitis capitata]QGT16317.1 hypothetical protein E0495_03525 [Wolbachia pipientis]